MSELTKWNDCTDTDAPDIRNERTLSEEALYRHLAEKFKDKSLVERITEIREHIFGQYGDVKGDPVTQVRGSKVRAGQFEFIPYEEVGPRYFPALIKRIDALYDYLLETEELDQGKQLDRLIRFAAVVYSLGITVHPYKDANGQTFRITSLSYLSEFLGRNFSLPRGSKIQRTAPINIVRTLPKDTPVGENTRRQIENLAYDSLSKPLKKIVELRYKSPTTPVDLEPEYTRQILSAVGGNESQLSELKQSLTDEYPELSELTAYLIEVLEFFSEVTFSTINEIYHYPFGLDIPGFDDAVSKIFTYSKAKQIEKLREYLDIVLVQEVGLDLLKEFIDTGLVSERDSLNSEIITTMEAVLNKATGQIFELSYVDDTFLGRTSRIPAKLLRKKYYGKKILMSRLRYAVIDIMKSIDFFGDDNV